MCSNRRNTTDVFHRCTRIKILGQLFKNKIKSFQNTPFLYFNFHNCPLTRSFIMTLFKVCFKKNASLSLYLSPTIKKTYFHAIKQEKAYLQPSTSCESKKERIEQPPHYREKSSNFFPKFPIDIVYTWVNGDDPQFKNCIQEYLNEKTLDQDRFQNQEELRYSLRSVFLYAPWVRKIFIVSNCSKPSYISNNDRIVWVNHSEIIDKQYLPTFNSHVIESYLWKIKSISEHFIYFNDDVFLRKPCDKTDFFQQNGTSKSYLEPYGIINYFSTLQLSERETWQSSAVNSANLIYEKTGLFPVQLHQHAPFCLKKSVLKKIEEVFFTEINSLRKNKFRTHDDISTVTILYPHYAFHLKETIRSHENSTLINGKNYNKKIRFQFFFRRLAPSFMCINDGGNSSGNSSYSKFKRCYLKKLYPITFPGEQ